MRLSYTLTFDQYRQAHFLWLKYGRGKPGYQALFTTWLAPLAGSIFLLAALLLLFIHPANRPAAIALFAIAAVSISLPISYRRTLRRLYTLRQFATTKFTADITAAGIQISPNQLTGQPARNQPTRGDSQAATHYDWTAFTRYSESPGLFVLVLAKPGFVALPTRALSDAQMEELRALLDTHLRRSTG